MVGIKIRRVKEMKYGYNLFSAWEIAKDRDSLITTMKALKEMGYDGVEFFLYFDIPPQEMKEVTEEIGLEPFSTHPRLFRFFNNLDEEIAYAKIVGMETLVMPHVVNEERNEAYYKKVIAAIPEWKKKCDAAGLRLAWHNHDFEFVPFGDKKYLMDEILAADDKMDFEIDTFWTTYAGVDTLEYMETYKERIRYVHFKDYAGKTGDGYLDIDFCPVGEGLADVKAIAAKARQIGAEWAVVEQDLHKGDILEDARKSIEFLKRQFTKEKRN